MHTGAVPGVAQHGIVVNLAATLRDDTERLKVARERREVRDPLWTRSGSGPQSSIAFALLANGGTAGQTDETKEEIHGRGFDAPLAITNSAPRVKTQLRRRSMTLQTCCSQTRRSAGVLFGSMETADPS